MDGGAHSLDNNQIGDAGAAAIAEALKTNAALTTLACVKGVKGARSALAANERWRCAQLERGSDRVRGRDGDRWGAQDQRRAERALVREKKPGADWRGCWLADAWMSGGARSLNVNHIGDAGAAAIGEALKTNAALKAL